MSATQPLNNLINKLNREVASYKAHLEKEAKLELRNLYIERLPTTLQCNNTLKRTIRHLSINKTENLEQFENRILKAINAAVTESMTSLWATLDEKVIIKTKLEAITLFSNKISNVQNKQPTEQEIKDAITDLENSFTQVEDKFLKRRSSSLFWQFIDRLKSIIGAKPSTLGVKGAGFAANVHTHFNKSNEKLQTQQSRRDRVKENFREHVAQSPK